ncbi:hypothetical protein C0993_004640, partial [Termitomyces sp. T159_Od127]
MRLDQLQKALAMAKPTKSDVQILADTVNASADRFDSLLLRFTTAQMETFHLYHLAACWSGGRTTPKAQEPPLTAGPVKPVASPSPSPVIANASLQLASSETDIRAAAAQMVFASRTSQDFITPHQVGELERWTGI